MKKKDNVDWKARVADQIAKYIEENNTLPWLRPWSCNGVFPMNLQTKHQYRGINALLLGMQIAIRGYENPYFLTIDGMKKMGGSFVDWEEAKNQGQPIVFWKMLKVQDKTTGEDKVVPLLKGWTVWHSSLMQGIELPPLPEAPEIRVEVDHMLDQYPNPPEVRHEPSTQAYYSPLFDRITLPLKRQFSSELGYAETLAHEAVHSTGHSSRLARFKDEAHPHEERYAREELVAEIGAGIMLQHLGLEPQMERMADYIAGWSRVIKDDPLMLVSAANRADKGVNLILGIEQPSVEEVAA